MSRNFTISSWPRWCNKYCNEDLDLTMHDVRRTCSEVGCANLICPNCVHFDPRRGREWGTVCPECAAKANADLGKSLVTLLNVSNPSK